MTAPYIAQDGDHQRLEWLSGKPVKVLLDAAASGGQLTMLLSTPPAGSASPMHVHGREDEIFLVLEGAALFVVGDQRREVGKGGVAFLPREVPHGYRVLEDAQMLTVATPAGVEEMFRMAGHDLSQPRPEGWSITQDALVAAVEATGGRIVGPPPV